MHIMEETQGIRSMPEVSPKIRSASMTCAGMSGSGAVTGTEFTQVKMRIIHPGQKPAPFVSPAVAAGSYMKVSADHQSAQAMTRRSQLTILDFVQSGVNSILLGVVIKSANLMKIFSIKIINFIIG